MIRSRDSITHGNSLEPWWKSPVWLAAEVGQPQVASKVTGRVSAVRPGGPGRDGDDREGRHPALVGDAAGVEEESSTLT